MAGNEWMIYGANGYAGGLILEQAIARGLRPVLGGRRTEAIRRLAERFGLPHRVFGLDSPDAIARGLDGIGTLLLAAGPFSATSAPTIAACLKTQTNYLDLAGEVAVLEAARGRDADAKKAGVVLLPAVGFDVVPTDCLAMSLHRMLPGANHLTLAFSLVGAPGPGSIRTAVEGAADGGWIRRGGKLEKVPAAWKSAKIPFTHGEKWSMTIPWGDLSTAYRSTGIPDIEVYMATPRPAILLIALIRPIMGLLRNNFIQNAVKSAVDKFVVGGNEAVREAGGTWVWGRVEDSAGQSVEGSLVTLETSNLTALSAIDIAVRVQAGEVTPGYATPALAFGPDYIRGFPKTTMTIGIICSN